MHRFAAAVLLAAAVLVVPTGTASAAEREFTLSATYSGLYPNADVSVPVTVHNPQTFDLAVHSAAVTVGDASPACRAGNLIATSFVGDVVVAAGRDGAVPIRMQMPASAPDACQGATFPLTFTATGAPTSPGQSAVDTEATGGFAFTGAEVTTTAVVGAGALALGSLLLATRRRHRREAS